MRLHYLQHVWFEDLGMIEGWAQKNNFKITRTALYEREFLPDVDAIDWLVVMGGPMGVYDEGKYPWLSDEKKFIAQAIEKGKTVLGVCLGAQLIAEVLGAQVKKNAHKEIGWFPIHRVGKEENILFSSPEEFAVFHWHGDTFDIPSGAKLLASSDACTNQAFAYDNGRVVGLQFHMELIAEGIERLSKQCANELVKGTYVQSAEEMKAQLDLVEKNNVRMSQFLGRMKDVVRV